VRDADVERLRVHGFDEEQIWLATFTAGIFNLFARMADAFGLRAPESLIEAIERG
jgi:alkylhydroperoxidase family enzyme